MRFPTEIHSSWFPIMNLLYKEPLMTLNTSILPNQSYQPLKHEIFKVFEMPVTDIKVVILGNEPYIVPGINNGYAFSINTQFKTPESLKIIRNELDRQGLNIPYYGKGWNTLNHWVMNGVFLLNTSLTVQTGIVNSHSDYWVDFTKRVISYISTMTPCIWLLWGENMQQYKKYIKNSFEVNGYDNITIKNIPANSDYNYILSSSFPSNYTYEENTFNGNNHFLYVNEILKLLRKEIINW